MILITVNEWIGPGRRMPIEQRDNVEVKESLRGLVTNLSLPEAIEMIDQHVAYFNSKYTLGITISIIAVSEIEDLTDHLIAKGNIEMIENLTID